MGTFSANGLFPNNSMANDNIVGLYSTTIANVLVSSVSYFNVVSDDQLVYEINTGTEAVIVSITNQNNLQLTNVSGLFSANDMLYESTTNAYGFVETLYTVNGTDVSDSFGLRFNQTLRLPFTSNNIPYQLYEIVNQEISNASGMVIGGSVLIPNSVSISLGNDVDITY